MKPETDNLTRLKMWAMALELPGNPPLGVGQCTAI